MYCPQHRRELCHKCRLNLTISNKIARKEAKGKAENVPEACRKECRHSGGYRPGKKGQKPAADPLAFQTCSVTEQQPRASLSNSLRSVPFVVHEARCSGARGAEALVTAGERASSLPGVLTSRSASGLPGRLRTSCCSWVMLNSSLQGTQGGPTPWMRTRLWQGGCWLRELHLKRSTMWGPHAELLDARAGDGKDAGGL